MSGLLRTGLSKDERWSPWFDELTTSASTSSPRALRRAHHERFDELATSASTSSPRAVRQVSRKPSLPAEERCVEQDPECAERLATPLRSESDEHDVPGIELHVERRGLSVQVFLADQIPRTQGRSRLLIARQNRAGKPVLRLEDGASVHENRAFLRHA